jgi:hypothetical protein
VQLVDRGVRILLGLAAAAVVATALAFEEADRIGRQFPGADGQILSITELIGPRSLWLTSVWSSWDGSGLPVPAGAIEAHVGTDWFFLLAYGALLGIAIVRSLNGGLRVAAACVLGALVVVDVAENLLLLGVARELTAATATTGAFPVALGTFLGVVEIVKFLVLAALVVLLLIARAFRRGLLDVLRRAARAAYAQRLSLVVTVLFVALTLLPPWHELLEQLPEVVRTWFDGEWRLGHIAAAASTVGFFAIVTLVLGRKRSDLYWEVYVLGFGSGGAKRRFGRVDESTSVRLARRTWPGPLRYAIWASPVPLVLAGAAFVSAQGGQVDIGRTGLFVGLVAGLVGLSFGLEWYVRAREAAGADGLGRAVGGTPAERRAFARDVVRAGDILAGLVIAAALLGVARSLTTPVLVQAAGFTQTPGPVVAVIALVATAGIVLAASASLPIPPAVSAPTESTDPVDSAEEPLMAQLRAELSPVEVQRTPTPTGWAVTVLAAIASLVFLGYLVVWPIETGRALGVVAVAAGALGSLTALIGMAALFFRHRRPLALSELLGLRSDPVILLLVVIPILVAQVAGAPQLHPVDRTTTVVDADERLDLEVALTAWRDDMIEAGCVRDGMVPLVLVAAQGGGIRAAVWTDAVVAQFLEAGECAARSVFLSSGVSGGAVGLAVAVTLGDDSDATDLQRAVAALSGAETLPAATAGLLVGDPFASLTGLRIASAEADSALPARWRDRAALIEDSWRAGDSTLGAAWDPEPGPATGYVVLNSTDILSGCRVAVSQLDLGDGSSGSTVERRSPMPRCDQGQEGPPVTIDLLELYDDQHCDFAADWATAAMLAARFPVVTPGGVVDFASICPLPRPEQPRLHLVDGGYAENSGVGFVADVAPRIGEAVRSFNSAAGDGPVVVPYVVYIQNSPGADLLPPRQEVVGELVVPIEGFGTRENQNTAATWLQRAISGLGEICPELPIGGTPCATGVELPDADARVVVAGIPTRPSAVVPLGWALAPTTLDRLFVLAGEQARCLDAPEWSEYACLGELMAALPDDPR